MAVSRFEMIRMAEVEAAPSITDHPQMRRISDSRVVEDNSIRWTNIKPSPTTKISIILRHLVDRAAIITAHSLLHSHLRTHRRFRQLPLFTVFQHQVRPILRHTHMLVEVTVRRHPFQEPMVHMEIGVPMAQMARVTDIMVSLEDTNVNCQ